MSELAKKFFESELSLSEDRALETELEAYPEAAEAFAEAALAHYALLGLPEPSWESRRALPFKRALWPLAGLFAAGLLYSSWPEGRRPAWYEEERQVLALAKAPAYPHRKAARPAPRRVQRAQAAAPEAAPRLPQSELAPRLSPPPRVRRGKLVGVVVKQAEAGPAEVWVEDESGRRMATLFDDTLPAGEKRFEWDGRRENGAMAAPGAYDIIVKRPGGEMRKAVLLRARTRG